MYGIDPNKNCHEYCLYRKVCRYAKGSIGQDPMECGTYYKLDDLANEAREIEWEEKHANGESDDW